MMDIITTIVLGVAALIFVLYPLSRGRKGMPATDEEPVSNLQEISSSAEHEQAARSALQEVELDHQLGNISDGDYQTLRERYMHRALMALKSRYDREQELDELIEDQLRKMKDRHEKHDVE
jgi:hypothetical protein